MDFKDENWTKIDVAIRLLWDSRVFSSYSMLEKVETAVFSPVNQWVAPWKICEDTKLWYLFHKHSRVIFQRGRRRNWRIFDSKILGFQLMWIHVEMNCWCDWILEIRASYMCIPKIRLMDKNLAIVVEIPLFYRVLHILSVVVWDFWTINSITKFFRVWILFLKWPNAQMHTRCSPRKTTFI